MHTGRRARWQSTSGENRCAAWMVTFVTFSTTLREDQPLWNFAAQHLTSWRAAVFSWHMVLIAATATLLATTLIGGAQTSGRTIGTTTITTGTTRPVRSVVFA